MNKHLILAAAGALAMMMACTQENVPDIGTGFMSEHLYRDLDLSWGFSSIEDIFRAYGESF